MKSILALARKDILLLMRDRVGFFFVFFFPLLYAVFFGTIFAGMGEDGMNAMKVAVVDEDQTEASQRFVRKLIDAEELRAFTAASEGPAYTRSDAVDLVRRGEVAAHVIIPAGFGRSLERLFQGEALRLDVGVDPGRTAESGMLQGLLTRYAFEEMQNLFGDREAMQRQVQNGLDAALEATDIDPLTKAVLTRFLKELGTFLETLPEEDEQPAAPEAQPAVRNPLRGWNPIDIRMESIKISSERTGPRSSFDITAPQALIWMFLGTAAAFAISLVMERTRGTLMRLRSAPVTLTQILAGKALACFLTTVGALLLLLLFFALVFGVRADSYPLLALALFCSAAAFVGIMMLIAVMGKTEAAVGGIGWAFLMIMAMAGGGMLPLLFMPSWMETVSNFSFVKWAIYAVEGAIWRGFTFGEMLRPCAILLAIGGASFFAGARIFKLTAD